MPAEFLKFHHCMMNLPVDAVEFLDCFIGAFKNADVEVWKSKDSDSLDLPIVHVYGFTYEDSKEGALKYFVERIGKAMRYPEFAESDVICFH